MPVLQPGVTAPSFSLGSTQGQITLAQYRGEQNVVLIFYPADNTPG